MYSGLEGSMESGLECSSKGSSTVVKRLTLGDLTLDLFPYL